MGQRIDSVLQQTYSNLEILILDDCSPDNSRDIIEVYAKKDQRIKTVYNEKNSGSTFKQWDKGISLCTGEYIWIAESDDYADASLVERLLAKIRVNPAIALAYCDSYDVDGENIIHGKQSDALGAVDAELWKHDFTVAGLPLVLRFMAYRNIIPNASAVLLRYAAAVQAGPAAAELIILGDWLYWVKIMSVGEVAYVASPLNYFRAHRNNVRSKTIANGTILEEITSTLPLLKSYGPLDESLYKRKIAELAESWFSTLVNVNTPFERHVKIYNNINSIEPGLGPKTVVKVFGKMFRNRLSGFKMLIGDGLINPLLKRLFKK
ncbi:glycosyltransferase family 2 protein [Hymenobacter nivis]|uniref:glycosyltransferase family 2 protein n=1 Tax=Hymenobacter nivis TaxID=1850093 RepID=UPI0013A54516|nr:glycosyltransferase [Hymenobacter nivis]